MNTDTLPVPTAKGNINPRHANPIPADKMGIAREVYFTTGCKPQEPTANNKSNNDNKTRIYIKQDELVYLKKIN